MDNRQSIKVALRVKDIIPGTIRSNNNPAFIGAFLVFMVLCLATLSCWRPPGSKINNQILSDDPVYPGVYIAPPIIKSRDLSSRQVKKQKDYRERLRVLFQAEKSPLKAYQNLKNQFSEAGKLEMIDVLFYRFAQAPAFQGRHYAKGESEELLRLWVNDAVEETNPLLRHLYSIFYPLCRPGNVPWQQFSLNASCIPLDGFLEIKSRPVFGSERSRLFNVRLDYLADLKGPFKSIIFENMSAEGRYIKYRRRISKPGIYRVSIYGELFFQELFVLVSDISVYVETSENMALIWVDSRQKSIGPPFSVNVEYSPGQVRSYFTDSLGLLKIKMRHNTPEDKGNTGFAGRVWSLNGGHLALGSIDKERILQPGPEDIYMYTSGRNFLPGSWLYYGGIKPAALSGGAGDSVNVCIRTPYDRVLFSKSYKWDEFGQFYDSLKLPVELLPGGYQITCRSSSGSDVSGRSNFYILSKQHGQSPLTVSISQSMPEPGQGLTALVYTSVPGDASLTGNVVSGNWFVSPVIPYTQEASGGLCRLRLGMGEEETLLKSEEKEIGPDGALAFTFDPPDSLVNVFIVFRVNINGSAYGQGVYSAVPILASGIYSQIFIADTIPSGAETHGFAGVKSFNPGFKFESLNLFLGPETGPFLPVAVQGTTASIPGFTLSPEKEGRYLLKAIIKSSDGTIVKQQKELVVSRYKKPSSEMELNLSEGALSTGDTLTINLSGPGGRGCLVQVGERAFKQSRVLRTDKDHASWRIPIIPGMSSNLPVHYLYTGDGGIKSIVRRIHIRDTGGGLNVDISRLSGSDDKGVFNGQVKVSTGNHKPVSARFALSLERLWPTPLRLPESTGEILNPCCNVTKKPESSTLAVIPGLEVSSSDALAITSLLGITTGYVFNNPHFLSDLGFPLPAGRSSNGVRGSGLYEYSTKGSGREGNSPGKIIIWEKNTSSSAPDFTWLGNYSSDTSGSADFNLKLPPVAQTMAINLTGRTHDTFFIKKHLIFGKSSLRLNLDFPQYLLAGDSSLVTAEVTNFSENNLDLKVQLFVDSVSILTFKGGSFYHIPSMSSNGTQKFEWPLRFAKAGARHLKVRCSSNSMVREKDTVIYVQNRHSSKMLSRSGVIYGAGERPKYYQANVDIPQARQAAGTSLEVEYYPSLVPLVRQTLSYLSALQSENTEEVVNCFFIHKKFINLMESQDYPISGLKAETAKRAALAFSRLQIGQNADGGWPWESGGQSDPCVSTLVAEALFSLITDNLLDWNTRAQGPLQSARHYLTGIAQDKDQDLNSRLFSLYGLCRTGGCSDMQSVVEKLWKNRGVFSPYGLVLLHSCTRQMGREEQSLELFKTIKSRVVEISSEASFGGNYRFQWLSQPVEASAQVLSMLSRWYPGDPLAPKIIAYLIRKRHGGYWNNSKTTAVILTAFCDYLNVNEDWHHSYTGKIFHNKKKVMEFNTNAREIQRWQGVLSLPDDNITANNRFVLGFQGLGQLYYSCNLNYLPLTEKDSATGRELTIAREYNVLRYTKNLNNKWELTRDTLGASIKMSDEIEIILKVKSNQTLSYTRIQDYLPAGFIMIQKDETWYRRWYHNTDLKIDPLYRNGMVLFQSGQLPSGGRSFHYFARAITQGRFHARPAEVHLQYGQGTSGTSRSAEFLIK